MLTAFAHSLRFKISAGVTLVIGVIVALYISLHYDSHRTMVMQEAGQVLTNTSQIIEGSLQHAMLQQDYSDLQSILDNVGRQPDIVTLMLLNSENVVRFAPNQKGVGTRLDWRDPNCQVCHQPGRPADRQNIVYITAQGRRVLRNCNPIENQPACYQCHDARARLNGVLITDLSLAETDAHLAEDLRMSVFLGGGAIGLVILTINLLMNRLVLTRLGRVVGVLQRFGQGDLSQRLVEQSSDELGRVAGAFNRMASTLQEKDRENARLYAELRQKEAARSQLFEKVIEAQEEERKRIARDLHDEFAQTLTALTINLKSVTQNLPEEKTALKQQLAETQALAAQMLKETSEWILELRPTVLDDLGLIPAIRWYAESRLESAGTRVRVEGVGFKHRLPAGIETALFRIMQEAVNNIAKHAHAHQVHIRLEANNAAMTVCVDDDGVGFDSAGTFAQKDGMRGIGLLGMRERAALLGGTLTIDSQIGRGTRVRVEVPWTEQP